MSVFRTVLALCLSAYYCAAILVLATQEKCTTTIITTTLITVCTFTYDPHPLSSSPTTTAALLGENTAFLSLTAPPTTTVTITTRDVQSAISQNHALNSPATSSSPPLAINSSPSPREATNPEWLLPVSISLLCYDFLAATAFIWCWVMGYFWWWCTSRRTGPSADVRMPRDSSAIGVLMNENLEWEMRRLGMV